MMPGTGRSVFTWTPLQADPETAFGCKLFIWGECREGVGQGRKPVKDTSVGYCRLWVVELIVPGDALRDGVEHQRPKTK